MGFFAGLFFGVAFGIGFIVCLARYQIIRSARRADLAATIAAFARMTVADSRKLLPGDVRSNKKLCRADTRAIQANHFVVYEVFKVDPWYCGSTIYRSVQLLIDLSIVNFYSYQFIVKLYSCPSFSLHTGHPKTEMIATFVTHREYKECFSSVLSTNYDMTSVVKLIDLVFMDYMLC
ncbi:hypothetical protein L6452_18654 [Arctium lappa]|uniref:Uncharacterized protein n=1 Tax=Arctium lappa TaxID=4217 RepID=A0ACB9C6U2_ARCLA|nr:hypothetical protein L6452_18654 [Arctium lappa]